MTDHEVWHSLAENVHHEHAACSKAARAAASPGVVRSGDGGKPLCEACAVLLKQDAGDPAAP